MKPETESNPKGQPGKSNDHYLCAVLVRVQEALRRARELEDVPIVHTKAMSDQFNQFHSYLKLVTFIEAEQRYVENRKIVNVPDRRYMEGRVAGLRYILMCVHDSFKHDHVRAENTDLCGACGYSRTHEVHYIEDVRGVKNPLDRPDLQINHTESPKV